MVIGGKHGSSSGLVDAHLYIMVNGQQESIDAYTSCIRTSQAHQVEALLERPTKGAFSINLHQLPGYPLVFKKFHTIETLGFKHNEFLPPPPTAHSFGSSTGAWAELRHMFPTMRNKELL